MAEESAKLRIPYIAASQAQKHVTHNEAMTLLDTLVQLSVLDKDLTAPPGSPTEGDTYIVAAAATGAWLGWDNRVARFIDGEWRSYLPGEGGGAGWLAWVLDEDAMYRFDGGAWALAGIEGPAGPDGPAGADGQSFQPDVVVALIAGRDAYDDEAAAFSVLVVSDAGNGDQPTLYFKLSAGSADWSDPITWSASSGGSAALRGHISGLVPSNNGADASNDMDISVGEATSDDGTDLIQLDSPITKRLDAAWAAGTGNGGLDTGSIANTTYHLWLIKRSDTGVVDALFSTSASSPTMPASYDLKRRIFSIKRVSGALQELSVQETSGGGLEVLFSGNLPLDVDVTDLGTSASIKTLSVPAGIKFEARINYNISHASALTAVYISSPDSADQPPDAASGSSGTPLATTISHNLGGARNGVGKIRVRTNNTSQIRARSSQTSTTLKIALIGWRDERTL